MLVKRKPALLRLFLFTSRVSAAAKAKAYARPAITITTAIVRSTAAIPAIVRPRSVTVASIVRAVMTIAVVAVMPIVAAMRAEVSRLLRHIGCGFAFTVLSAAFAAEPPSSAPALTATAINNLFIRALP